MTKDIEQRHNIDDALSLAKFFYRKALNSLHEIDFMANPSRKSPLQVSQSIYLHCLSKLTFNQLSVHALQAICMFVPCGYAFG